jgi:hypothetical protein
VLGVAHRVDRANLQDCKLSGSQGQDGHQSETYDKKGDSGEVQGTKDEQAVPTANWNVKSAVWMDGNFPRQGIFREVQELCHGHSRPVEQLLAQTGVDWVQAIQALVHQTIRYR